MIVPDQTLNLFVALVRNLHKSPDRICSFNNNEEMKNSSRVLRRSRSEPQRMRSWLRKRPKSGDELAQGFRRSKNHPRRIARGSCDRRIAGQFAIDYAGLGHEAGIAARDHGVGVLQHPPGLGRRVQLGNKYFDRYTVSNYPVLLRMAQDRGDPRHVRFRLFPIYNFNKLAALIIWIVNQPHISHPIQPP